MGMSGMLHRLFERLAAGATGDSEPKATPQSTHRFMMCNPASQIKTSASVCKTRNGSPLFMRGSFTPGKWIWQEGGRHGVHTRLFAAPETT